MPSREGASRETRPTTAPRVTGSCTRARKPPAASQREIALGSGLAALLTGVPRPARSRPARTTNPRTPQAADRARALAPRATCAKQRPVAVVQAPARPRGKALETVQRQGEREESARRNPGSVTRNRAIPPAGRRQASFEARKRGRGRAASRLFSAPSRRSLNRTAVRLQRAGSPEVLANAHRRPDNPPALPHRRCWPEFRFWPHWPKRTRA